MLTRHFLAPLSDQLPSRLKARVRHTSLGGWAAGSLAQMRTPGIIYLSGKALLAFDERWYREVEAITRAEKHLLTKTRAELEPEARAGRVTIAVDTNNGYCVVGCVIAWGLCPDEQGVMWHELGTYIVRRDYRFKSGDPRSLPIGHALFHNLLYTHRHVPVLMTTTNPAVFHIGMRHGMIPMSFERLCAPVRRDCCAVCPTDKTQASNYLQCKLRDNACRMFLNRFAWKHLGHPRALPCPQ